MNFHQTEFPVIHKFYIILCMNYTVMLSIMWQTYSIP